MYKVVVSNGVWRDVRHWFVMITKSGNDSYYLGPFETREIARNIKKQLEPILKYADEERFA